MERRHRKRSVTGSPRFLWGRVVAVLNRVTSKLFFVPGPYNSAIFILYEVFVYFAATRINYAVR